MQTMHQAAESFLANRRIAVTGVSPAIPAVTDPTPCTSGSGLAGTRCSP